jgi:hypothetical protein
MTKVKVGVGAMILIGFLSVFVWQEHRMAGLTVRNRELGRQAEEVPALRQEVARLQAVERSQGELERLRLSDAQLRTDVAALRGRLGELKRADAAPAKPTVEASAAELGQGSGTNGPSSAMGEMMRTAVRQQVLGQLTRMTSKLNLTPDQEQKVREVLLRQAEQSSAAVQRVFTGKMDTEEITKLAKSAGNPEEEIKALLTPEQLARYKEHKEEEAGSNARLMANSELLTLQGALGLTSEQQDKAFAVLYDQSLSQMTGTLPADLPRDSKDPAAFLRAQFDQKSKALEAVLTPTQMEKYRELQQSQLKMISSMLPKAKDAE